MTIGTVKFFNPDKGFGFIAPDGGGDDAFVHISAVERAGMRTLDKDQRVSYDLEKDQRGKTSAVNLAAACLNSGVRAALRRPAPLHFPTIYPMILTTTGGRTWPMAPFDRS